MIYKLQNDKNGNVCAIALIHDENTMSSIPMDDANTDYQAYLKWLAEGNTPLPADE